MLRSGRLHYAWVVAGVTFLTLLMTSGFRATPSILIVPMEREFGWSRATISVALSINLLLFGLISPFAAAVLNRYGVRRTIGGALALVAAGAAATTVMHAPWQLDLLWGVVVGTATGAVSVPLAAAIANRWFVARKGLVTGVLTASYATGQLIFLPLLAWVAGAWGWRWTSGVVSIVAVGMVLPLVLVLMRERPSAIGLRAYGADHDEVVPPLVNPFGQALGGLRLAAVSRDFWLLAASFFVCGATTTGLIGTHMVPAAMDHGMSEVAGAGLLALIGVFDIVGSTASGWLTDRYDARRLLVAYYVLRGVSLLALPFAFGSPHLALIAFCVVFGLDWVATVPPTVALTVRAFGRENVGIVFGWIFASHQIGAALAAWGAGFGRTETGDYRTTFIAAGAFCAVAALAVLRVRAGAPGPRIGDVAPEPA